jgi:hypothetical protein
MKTEWQEMAANGIVRAGLDAPDVLAGPENALQPRQEMAALYLAMGDSPEQAAKKAGCGVRTLRRWMAEDADFTARVKELRAEMTSQAVGRLVASMTKAAEQLAILAVRGSREAIRLQAAKAVLELAIRVRETEELEERIVALEARLAQSNGAKRLPR